MGWFFDLQILWQKQLDSSHAHPHIPQGSLKKAFEWVADFAAIEENTYVSVIKSIIQRLIPI
jgi:hypothetical protein